MDSRTAVGFIVCWFAMTAFPLTNLPSQPDLLLLAVLILGLERGPATGQFGGFFLGAMIDLLVLGRMGISSASYTIIGHVGGRLSHRVGRARILLMIVTAPVAVFFAEVAAVAALGITGLPVDFDAFNLLLRSGSTMALAPVIYIIRNPLGLGRRRK